MNVYAIKHIKPMDEELFRVLLQVVSEEKRRRIERYRMRKNAEQALISDILCRFVVGTELGVKNEDICIQKNAYGKPLLAGHDGFHFNLSHSGDWVVCATDGAPVGIDVEQITAIDFQIAKRFFSTREYDDLMGLPQADRLSYFYDLWTLKESYVKAVGKGLSMRLNSFTFTFADGDIVPETADRRAGWFFRQYVVDRDYKLAVCATHNDFPAQVIYKDIRQLCEEILRL